MSGSDDTSTFLQLQSAFEQGSHRRAVLYRWMLERHDKLSAMFGTSRINWIAMAAAFNDLGFRNANGDELKPEAVRKTWDRVKKRQASLVARRARRAMVPDPAPPKADLLRVADRRPAPPAPRSVVVHDPVVSVPAPVENTSEPDADEDDGGLAMMKAEMAWRSGRGKKPD